MLAAVTLPRAISRVRRQVHRQYIAAGKRALESRDQQGSGSRNQSKEQLQMKVASQCLLAAERYLRHDAAESMQTSHRPVIFRTFRFLLEGAS